MFSALFRLTDQEIDRLVWRVLSNKRVDALVDRIARRVIELALAQLSQGLQALDQEGETTS